MGTSVRENETTAYTPSDFQLEIQSLSRKEFATETNIKELILKEYREEKNDANAIIPEKEMNDKLIYYYVFRMRTSEWYHTVMKNIKFLKCECKRKSQNDAQKSGTDTVQKPSKTVSVQAVALGFQKEVMAMDFHTFVNETNVKDLVIENFNIQNNGANKMTEADMQLGLKQFDILRTQDDKWAEMPLQSLKYKKCECQRKKKFLEKWTQTDATDVLHVDSQCSPTDFETNDEIKEPQQCEEMQNLNRSKTDMLTIHEITDNQIIHIQSNLSTPEPCVDHKNDSGKEVWKCCYH